MSKHNWFVSLELWIQSEFVWLSSLQSCSEYWSSPSSCSGLSKSFFCSKPFESESNHLRIVRIQNEKLPFVDHHKSLPTRSNNCFIPNHENCRIKTKWIKSKPTPVDCWIISHERMPRSIEFEPKNSYRTIPRAGNLTKWSSHIWDDESASDRELSPQPYIYSWPRQSRI
jgi:hypothetical protein